MMEAKNSVHSDNMGDDEIRQHNIQSDISELLVISGQVSAQTAVYIPQVLNWL